MNNYGTIFLAALPVFLVLGAGYLVRVKGWLTQEADASIMKLVVNLLYPSLILQFILGNEALKNPSNLVMAPLLGYGTIALGIGLAFLVAPLAGMVVGKGRRTFAYSAGIYNYGYIPIPLIAALFPGDKATAGVLLVLNVGIEAAIWSVGLLVLTGEFDRRAWRRLLNPPVFAMVIGLALNFAGLPDATGVVGDAYGSFYRGLSMLGATAIPLGLMVSGATLADLVKTGEWRGRWPVAGLSILMRIVVLPIIFIILALTLPITTELQRVLAVQAAMPAAMLPIVIARFYGGSPAIAVQVAVATTVVGFFTIPVVMALAFRIVGV